MLARSSERNVSSPTYFEPPKVMFGCSSDIMFPSSRTRFKASKSAKTSSGNPVSRFPLRSTTSKDFSRPVKCMHIFTRIAFKIFWYLYCIPAKALGSRVARKQLAISRYLTLTSSNAPGETEVRGLPDRIVAFRWSKFWNALNGRGIEDHKSWLINNYSKSYFIGGCTNWNPISFMTEWLPWLPCMFISGQSILVLPFSLCSPLIERLHIVFT